MVKSTQIKLSSRQFCYKTGFTLLDKHTGGLRPRSLFLFIYNHEQVRSFIGNVLSYSLATQMERSQVNTTLTIWESSFENGELQHKELRELRHWLMLQSKAGIVLHKKRTHHWQVNYNLKQVIDVIVFFSMDEEGKICIEVRKNVYGKSFKTFI